MLKTICTELPKSEAACIECSDPTLKSKIFKDLLSTLITIKTSLPKILIFKDHSWWQICYQPGVSAENLSTHCTFESVSLTDNTVHYDYALIFEGTQLPVSVLSPLSSQCERLVCFGTAESVFENTSNHLEEDYTYLNAFECIADEQDFEDLSFLKLLDSNSTLFEFLHLTARPEFIFK